MPTIIYDDTPSALPYSFQYTPSDDDPGIIYLGGSAWAAQPNAMIGLTLEVNGSVVCSAQVFSNGPSTHRTLVPGVVKYAFPIDVKDKVVQPVTITIAALNAETVFDQNDRIILMQY
ncbi:MAG: hypothetical protein AAFW73_22860 [Bacteroidota bacterium]